MPERIIYALFAALLAAVAPSACPDALGGTVPALDAPLRRADASSPYAPPADPRFAAAPYPCGADACGAVRTAAVPAAGTPPRGTVLPADEEALSRDARGPGELSSGGGSPGTMAESAGEFARSFSEAAVESRTGRTAGPPFGTASPGSRAASGAGSVPGRGETLLAMAPRTGDGREWQGVREKAPAPPVRVLFLGDIMTHSQQLKRAKTARGYDFVKQFARIRPYLRGGAGCGEPGDHLLGG
ncbi:MAG: hypothetical protein LBQ79_10405 [Deltaproteobacteria bacterium]|jgi:hypothetical protein|nr:hypothetical protein [Deltaproteobacteria bacterium]